MTMATVPDMQMNTDMTAVRFPAWIGLTVTSAICMAAFCSEIDKDQRESDEKWSLAVYSISMCVAVLATVAYLFVRGMFVGQIFEMVMVALVLGFYGFGLPTIMGPDNSIAVSSGFVLNANLYFFSWGSFALTIFLFLSLFQEKMGVDIRQASSAKQTRWFFLATAAVVVMSSATRIFKSDSVDCGNSASPLSGQELCKRTSFAIALGAVTFVAGVGVMLAMMKNLMAAIMQLGVTVILAIMWVFGVGFITFGGLDAPGATIGNLYFSTWISFLLVVTLFAESLQAFLSGSAAAEANTASEDSSAPPMEEEDIGENPAIPEEDF